MDEHSTEAPALDDELKDSDGGAADVFDPAEDTITEERLQELLTVRLSCIKPVLEAELKEALGMTFVKCSHLAIIRRNVSAHGRCKAASILVSVLPPQRSLMMSTHAALRH